MSQDRFTENPFYVLGLLPECSRAEMEREGQKLLGMLELGLPAAQTYKTPLGAAQRDSDKVRQAMAELRDPHKRLLHEVWALLPAEPLEPASNEPASSVPGPWPDAASALGFGVKK